MELYPFQDELLQAVRQKIRTGHRSVLMVSPTGSGKTVIFSYLAGRLTANAKRTVILAHRQELLVQIGRALREFRVPHGFIAPNNDYSSAPRVHVASVFSVARRLDRVEPPDYIIVDEAHHAIRGSTWGAVMDHWQEAIRLGVTATPQRLSGEGLGDMFSCMVMGPSTARLIAEGYLARYKVFAPAHQLNTKSLHMRAGDYVGSEVEAAMSKPTIVGDAIAHYRKHLNGAPMIGFAASVKSAHFYAEQYRAHGFKAVAIDGESKDRAEITRDFAAGRINVLMSCDLISEGYDMPGAHGAQLLRPTESLALYLQQCGRALRRDKGKPFAFILDHVGNSARHGLPCDDREWSLEGVKRRGRRDPDDVAIRQCPKCGAVTTAGAAKCPECGHVFEVVSREVKETEGELSEIDVEAMRRARKVEQGQANSIEALTALGKQRGYKNPHAWARYVWNARASKRNAA